MIRRGKDQTAAARSNLPRIAAEQAYTAAIRPARMTITTGANQDPAAVIVIITFI
ncbi:hypothetical protein S58_60110 [Bradyrhizobium oligotrophicum S58]|uniref:Uncharacterized protein n=1 Tax=Bradyrhizobium oligotrophicum S58 TaxID=1245469 RepID=M4ZDT6_9BRAD|nr:hypothetical protein S58_60110 [Bradyrhizobium oligotrophicum S58]